MPLEEIQVNGWLLDETVAPTASLSQGDLIKFENEDDPLKKAGIVVTADCDLERKKHARLVTLVPVVAVDVLVEKYLLPEDCERKRSQIEQYAFAAFSISEQQEYEARRAILHELISETKHEDGNVSQIASEFTIYGLDEISISDYLSLMSAMKMTAKKTSALASQIRDRGDIMLLPDPTRLGISGSMAWVRHIWQVPVSNIALRTSEVSQRPGERVARLASPYRYRLTQLMAQVFSDIGLPDIPDTIADSLKMVYNVA